MFLEKGRGIRVTTDNSGEQALELLGNHKFDAIISDYAMPGMNGIEFMKRVKAMGDDTPFIIFTGKGRQDVVIDALNFGADLYLEKSSDPRTQFSDMMQKVRNIVAIRADIQVAREKMKIFSSPTCSAISTFAPSSVPTVSAPFSASFMLPVPEASFPAVEICSEISAAGISISAAETQ